MCNNFYADGATYSYDAMARPTRVSCSGIIDVDAEQPYKIKKTLR